jgi:hypothetical protein
LCQFVVIFKTSTHMTKHTVRFLKFLISLQECYRRFEAKSGFSQGPETGRPILVQRYMYSKEVGGGGGGGGGGGFGKTFLWKTFEVYVTSYHKHTWFVSTEFVPLCCFT